MTTGIILIVLGFCLLCALDTDSGYSSNMMVFGLPGLLGIASGILSIVSVKKENSLLLIAGICALVGALINMIAIADISIYFIAACVFGIFQIIYGKKND